MLEKGVSDYRHECMAVKALPGSCLEVIKTELFLQLLMSLLANPSCLDGGRQGAQVGRRRRYRAAVVAVTKFSDVSCRSCRAIVFRNVF